MDRSSGIQAATWRRWYAVGCAVLFLVAGMLVSRGIDLRWSLVFDERRVFEVLEESGRDCLELPLEDDATGAVTGLQSERVERWMRSETADHSGHPSPCTTVAVWLDLYQTETGVQLASPSPEKYQQRVLAMKKKWRGDRYREAAPVIAAGLVGWLLLSVAGYLILMRFQRRQYGGSQ